MSDVETGSHLRCYQGKEGVASSDVYVFPVPDDDPEAPYQDHLSKMAEHQEEFEAFRRALRMAHFYLQNEEGAYHIDRGNRAQEVPHSQGSLSQNRDV